MSFRATFITQFLYLDGREKQLKEIKEKLEIYDSCVEWTGRQGIGYFHGIIKGLYPEETKNDEKQINEEMKKYGIELVFNHESDVHPQRVVLNKR